MKRMSIPLCLNLAKAYPAMEQKSNVLTIVETATMRLFNKARPMFAATKTVRNASQFGLAGSQTIGIEKISLVVLSDPVSIQNNGNAITRAPNASRTHVSPSTSIADGLLRILRKTLLDTVSTQSFHLHKGNDQHHDEEYHCLSQCISHLKVSEPGFVNVEQGYSSGVSWSSQCQ